jgi:phage RecT family recombinase
MSKQISNMLATPVVKQRLDDALGGVISGPMFAELCVAAANDDALAAVVRKAPESFVNAALRCAQIGLPPGKDLSFVALFPEGGQVGMRIQWQGYKALMERIPGVAEVTAHLVIDGDDFELGVGETVLRHRFDPFDTGRALAKDWGNLRGAYAQIAYADGRRDRFVFVRKDQMRKRRNCARTQKFYDNWPEEMATKTVYRYLWGRRVLTVDPAKAAAVARHLGAAEAIDREAEDPDLVDVTPRSTAVPLPSLVVRHSTPVVEADPETVEPTPEEREVVESERSPGDGPAVVDGGLL